MMQILQYEFLGPIKLSEWGPPMDEVIYLVLKRTKDTFEIIYAGESGKTDETGFFTKNDKFGCWVQNAGSEQDLYLSIYPMWDSNQEDRKRILTKSYKDTCPSAMWNPQIAFDDTCDMNCPCCGSKMEKIRDLGQSVLMKCTGCSMSDTVLKS